MPDDLTSILIFIGYAVPGYALWFPPPAFLFHQIGLVADGAG